MIEKELCSFSIAQSNLKDQYAYTFDGSKFIAVLKNDVLGELVDNHFENIELSVEEYKDKLNSKTIEVLDKFIEKINDDDRELDYDAKPAQEIASEQDEIYRTLK